MRENSAAADIELTADERAELETSIEPRRIRSSFEERSRLAVRRMLYSDSGELNAAGKLVDKGRDAAKALKSKIR
jgi:hypothetical protein